VKATIVDLRYKTTEILKALDRNESVTISYHGKVKGVLSPAKNSTALQTEDHPFFAMNLDHSLSVEDELESLRKPRYDL